MDKLPIELINLIYEFDSTKKELFNKVIEQFKLEIDYIYDSMEMGIPLKHFNNFNYFKLKKLIIQENINFHEHMLHTITGKALENYIKDINWELRHGFNPFWIN